MKRIVRDYVGFNWLLVLLLLVGCIGQKKGSERGSQHRN